MKGDIQIIKPRSTKDNMPYIHGNYVTPYFNLVGEELKWDDTSFFYGYGGGIYLRHVIWVRVCDQFQA